jgi:myo-inositol 2-dehydrogenase/D-chiro-inositol 1-dehydrogenase
VSATAAGERTRVAVVGAGRMGRVHLDALDLSDRCQAVAVVDPVAGAREQVAGRVAATYASVPELLDAGGFDAAVIASPSGLHPGLVAQFAAAGVSMLCEKPCGLRAEAAQAAADVARRAGVLLQVGYWRRFVPELERLQARLAAGELGRVGLVVCHQWDAEPPAAGFRGGSGGIGIDMAVHEVDQLRWLLGQELEDLSAVRAGGDTPADAGDPDSAAVLARLSAGAAGVITLGRRFPPGDSCWVEVFADGGYERVPFMWGAEGDEVFRRALAAQADAFAAALAGAAQRGATGADAVAALRAAERIGQALVSGTTIPAATKETAA